MPADRIRQPDSLIEPTYEGRRLPKPHEEVVDQGLQFDLGTLQRRRALKIFGIGIAGTALAACSPGSSGSGSSSSAASQASTLAASSSTASSNLTEIPDETAGPYPGDGSNGADVLEQSGVVRRDIRSSFGTGSATAEGVAMTLKLTILDIAAGGGPMAGAAVYVWHCNRAGEYSMYASAIKNENYLRGVQLTDSNGVVEFTSIFPACYSGRWPHIHFEVYPDEASITDATKAIATGQLARSAGPDSAGDACYRRVVGPSCSEYPATGANLICRTGVRPKLARPHGFITVQANRRQAASPGSCLAPRRPRAPQHLRR